MQVSVADGRLSIDSGASANLATRINYVHIVGLSAGGNSAPAVPNITEPAVDGQTANPSDAHMEAVGYSDPEGNSHKSTDWEIWTTGAGAQPVWQTLGIEGVERLHTHLGDGVFMNSRAGETTLVAITNYQLRVRFRDGNSEVSGYAVRTFHTGSASTTFPMELQDVADSPAPTWTSFSGGAVDLPLVVAFLHRAIQLSRLISTAAVLRPASNRSQTRSIGRSTSTSISARSTAALSLRLRSSARARCRGGGAACRCSWPRTRSATPSSAA